MKINVGVLFGGESVEHEVSVITAMQAMEALDKTKYEVIPVYISKQRLFYSSDLLRNMETYRNLNELANKVPQVTFVRRDQKVYLEPVKKGLFTKPVAELDVLLPIVHGTNGEDGTLQGFLEMLKIPYGGCDVMAAAVGQDKVFMKHILENSGLPVGKWFWLYGHDFESNKAEVMKKVHNLSYPVVLKPACLGSSVGIVIAHNDEEFEAGIEETSQYDNKVVVEKMVCDLIEINCSVLGDCFECRPSILEQVAKQDEILSFHDKYESNGGAKKTGGSKGMASTARIVPAPLDEETTKLIQDLAVKTFKTLSASGVSRIDFMMDGQTKEIFVNEINTIPGSLAFYLWEKTDCNFTQLMDELIELSIKRQRRREKMIFSYDTNLLANFSLHGAKGSKGIKNS